MSLMHKPIFNSLVGEERRKGEGERREEEGRGGGGGHKV